MNYKILGSDQKEYGPVPLEQLRQWLAEGRVNAQTMVQPEGGTDWRPLAGFAEVMPPAAAAPAPLPVQTVPVKDAATAVRVPAILLMVAGGLGVLVSLARLAQSLFGLVMPFATNLPPNLPPQMARFIKMTQTMGVPSALLALALDGLMLFGGLSLLRLERSGLCMAAAIIAMLCGNSCCCPIGLVAGIWALVMLSKPEVKSAFH